MHRFTLAPWVAPPAVNQWSIVLVNGERYLRIAAAADDFQVLARTVYHHYFPLVMTSDQFANLYLFQLASKSKHAFERYCF